MLERVKLAMKAAILARRTLRDERLPKSTRRALCGAAGRLHCIPRGRVPNPFPLCGYAAHFLDEGHLRFLVDELFLNASYMFVAETDSPRIIDCVATSG